MALNASSETPTALLLQKNLIFTVMKKEIWKAVDGYEGLYEVSSYGNVRSVDRMESLPNGTVRRRNGCILKQKFASNGYLKCNLSKNTKEKTESVHRLVAQAFIPNPNNLPEVNHKDEDKANNHVDNLEWCSHLYNMRFGTGSKRAAEKQSTPVLQIDKDTNEIIAEYSSMAEAGRQLNIRQGNISNCCKGKYNTTGGFKLIYK